ncbi:MAG: transglutaminase family protein [Gammaproteobacteria bacterium]|nr:transglutaminase family protein [Gammaproteobacteria bacterium]
MQFRVRHLTHYSYARAVNLAPHIIRLHPRADANVLVQAYTCDIDPVPRVCSYCLDDAGNVVLRVEFDTPTLQLQIDSCFVADTRSNVHDLQPVAAGLPAHYSRKEAESLKAYCEQPVLDAVAGNLLDELTLASHGQPLLFLDALNTYIYRHIKREIRDLGAPQTPAQTLTRRCGACRDLAVLFIAVCRAQGFAARFVSGYQAKAEVDHGQRYMHAWPEVYVPGVGWRGYDPTHASLVDDAHVAVAAAFSPAGAAPVEGSYYGEAVRSELSFRLSIEVE